MSQRTRYFLFFLFLAALALLAPAVRAAVTEQDMATLTETATTAKKAAGTEGLSLTWVLGRMAISLGVVFGLMWGVLWAARKYLPQTVKNSRGAGMIEVLASRSLGQRRSLLLVRVRGKMLLLGVSPGAIQTLTDLEAEDESGAWQEAALDAGLPPAT